MDIHATLAAQLAILTETRDEPDIDIAESLLRLAADARAAVASYLGIVVMVTGSEPPITFSAFDDDVGDADVRTSLMLVAPSAEDAGPSPGISLILFAGIPGAFVDLAADLCWMAGLGLADARLDQHLNLAVDRSADDALYTASVINQALGVLIGQGHTPDQADLALSARAAIAGTDRRGAAVLVLGTISATDQQPNLGSE